MVSTLSLSAVDRGFKPKTKRVGLAQRGPHHHLIGN